MGACWMGLVGEGIWGMGWGFRLRCLVRFGV